MMWRIDIRVRDEGGVMTTTTEDVEGDVAAVNTRLAELREALPDAEFGAAQVPHASDPPVQTSPPTPDISDRQFAQALAVRGIITEDEALAWAARGDLPKALTDAIATLPLEQRFPARMLLSAATTYERGNPLVGVLGAILGMDGAALDAIWALAASL